MPKLKVVGYRVAPRAGAWIETSVRRIMPTNLSSLLVQERGLKQECNKLTAHNGGSLLVQERGLKPGPASDLKSICPVAPRAGAWIET